MATNFTDMADKELFDLLEKAGIFDRLMNDPTWKALQEARDRIIERAVVELVVKVKAHETERIIELQTIIRKYKYGIFDELKVMKMEFDQAFTEAEDRGLIGGWLKSAKEAMGIK